ncbi:hypothetical protein ACWV27_00035 [Massilia varians]
MEIIAEKLLGAEKQRQLPIDFARDFVKLEVQIPALNSALPQKIKNKTSILING